MVEVNFRLLDNPAAQPPGPQQLQMSGPVTRYPATAGITSPPVLIEKREPDYTPEARQAKYQGPVVLYVVIGADGAARNIRVLRSLGLGIDEKAIEAVQQWRWRPAYKDGQPVETIATIEVSFRLP